MTWSAFPEEFNILFYVIKEGTVDMPACFFVPR